MKRQKTNYPGVFYRLADRIGGKGEERVFYIRYKKDAKTIEEKVGRQYADAMTAAKASRIRADIIEGRREPRRETREAAKVEQTEPETWTMEALWDKYAQVKADLKGLRSDMSRFDKHIRPVLGAKEPQEITQDDIDKLRSELFKQYKPQTVKHVLSLLKRIVRFGFKRQLCGELSFPVDPVRVDNRTTEDLTADQLARLLRALDDSPDITAANMMRMALYTGMRRGELFKLKWTDIDFERNFIDIRQPKGGVSQKIPLNNPAREVLKNHPVTGDHVFTRRDGGPLTDVRKRVNRIKAAGGIGADFRALHGLRHAYASMLASSGQVDMYTLQRLLTHKSPQMTQRYAHLRDETLKAASELAGNIIDRAREG